MFLLYMFFFFKQKTAYEMRISDWSSDVCSSDLQHQLAQGIGWRDNSSNNKRTDDHVRANLAQLLDRNQSHRSEEHTSELQSLMRSSYAVFCLKKKLSFPLVHRKVCARPGLETERLISFNNTSYLMHDIFQT